MKPLMKRLVFSAVVLILMLGAVQAQATVPNYVTGITNWQYLDDGSTLEFTFSVQNLGAPMPTTIPAYLVIVENGVPRQLASVDIRPLSPSDSVNGVLRTTLLGLPQEGPLIFRVVLVAPADASGTFLSSPDVQVTRAATGTGGDAPFTATGDTTAANQWRFTFPALNLDIDLNDPAQLTLAVIVFVLIVIILWLLLTLVRQITRRPPEFGNWQPPYATATHIDPYSVAGMRQGWQQAAQANVITIPPAPNAAQAIKLLNGNDGTYLNGWEITALRLNLYDQYGRVTQSQVLANRPMVKTLNRMGRRRDRLNFNRTQRRLLKMGQVLTRRFIKRVNKRNAMLPIALDIRFKARHGEVSILFELYQAANGGWRLADRWQPEMLVVSRTMYESYTYSIFGMSGGETMREYRKRIAQDIARWLLILLAINSQQAAPKPDARPAANTDVQFQPSPAPVNNAPRADEPKTDPRRAPAAGTDKSAVKTPPQPLPRTEQTPPVKNGANAEASVSEDRSEPNP